MVAQMAAALNVLVIEDNLGDFHLLEESFEEQEIPARLFLASDAVQAFGFLGRQGTFAAAPVPDLILLDLNLPVIGGARILDIIRTTTGWSSLPVLVLTSSSLRRDHDEVTRHGIEGYLIKPTHYDGYLELARQIGDTCRRLSRLSRRRTEAPASASRPAPERARTLG
jgi:CheY-like chemotaxis protein